MKYDKPFLTLSEQLNRLVERGLIIPEAERQRAMRWLKFINYYRLSAYLRPFRAEGETFKPGTTFNHVAGLYLFDRRLRLCLLDAIERIEVALRTQLTYHIAQRYGPFGHTNPKNFLPDFDHQVFMTELREAEENLKEVFVAHYRSKYSESEHLPIWMASELLSFGSLSRLYSACERQIRKAIALNFDAFQDWQFASWLHAISVTRNICAHHSRLWNRELRVKPSLPHASAAFPYVIPQPEKIYCILVLVRHCLLRVAPRCLWRERLFTLFDTHPDVSLSDMGIPANWRIVPPWTNPLNPVP